MKLATAACGLPDRPDCCAMTREHFRRRRFQPAQPANGRALSRGKANLAWLRIRGRLSSRWRRTRTANCFDSPQPDSSGPRTGSTVRSNFFPVPANVVDVPRVQSLFVDRQGNRWVGTLGRGLFRFRRAPVTAYSKEEGLSDSPFRTVFQDREGRIWLGGDDSLYWFDGRGFHRLPGLSEIAAIAQTPDGDLWFGGSGALHRWRSGVLTRYPLETPAIHQLLVDRDGTLWFDAPGRTLSRDLYRFRDGNFEKVDSDVLQMAEDVNGGRWLAMNRPLRIRYLRAGKTVDYGPQGLPQTGVVALEPDSSGALWFATASGLHRLRNGKFASITARNGLTTDVVGMLIDGQGILWPPSNQGIFRLTLRRRTTRDRKLDTIRHSRTGSRKA